jgi:Ca2+-binding EF-hand superfamily protein
MTTQWRTSLVGIGLFLFAPAVALAQADEPNNAADDTQDILYLADEGVIILRLHIRIDGKSYRTVWNEFVDSTFKELDTNGDGFLVAAEATAIPNRNLLRQSGMIAAGNSSATSALRPDTNGDGKVTKKELSRYFDRVGFRPFMTRINTAQPQRRDLVIRGMANNSAQVDLIGKLDRDADGRLSKEELENALQTLHKLDLDDDETISISELTPPRNPFVAFSSSRSSRNQQPQANFISLAAGESPTKLVRQLLSRYDKPKTTGDGDAEDKDNTLSADELGMPSESFAVFDADSNGQLDFDELRQFISNPSPSVELVIRLGKREPDQPAVGLVASNERFHGKVRSADGSASLILPTVQLELVADTRWTADSSEFYKQQFKAADTDNNGYLEKKEVERNGVFRRLFALMDRDGDGKLFEKEMLAFVKRQLAANQSRSVLNITDQGRDFFKILDLNSDNRLSRREFMAAARRMTNWDLNDDGFIDQAEIPKQFRLALGRGTSTFSNARRVVATPYGPRAVTPANRSDGPVWFQKMDRNRDGDVSPREFLGTKDDFKKLDKNHDGLLDAAEAFSAK